MTRRIDALGPAPDPDPNKSIFFRTGKAVEVAAANLPCGWEVLICLSRNGHHVALLNPHGGEHDFPSNQETIAETINDALERAIELAKADDWIEER